MLLQLSQIKEFLFAKGETLDEYWQYTHYIFYQSLRLPKYDFDDGGDATGLLILGSKAGKDLSVLDNPGNEEEIALLTYQI